MERWSFLLAPYSVKKQYKSDIQELISFVNDTSNNDKSEIDNCYEYFYIFEKSLLNHLNASYQSLVSCDSQYLYYYMQSNGTHIRRFCALLLYLIKGEMLSLNHSNEQQLNYLFKQSTMNV
ncbi:hypothetical protein ACTFQF_00600 [Aliivibrio fischeri]|uniref:Uncharacterized protein n=1 Tax=Aliivibrio fischeri (strain MJ11) TaxID=388396 RepID=B5EWD4_ALIFM|nr:hypothetical protein [Aliivibrio fischeri]ACH64770.1 hypothetical protein VFMJ11_B0191 [Aliivibrio fischeri MJ11]MUK37554.1 hypothetical protein [Aliivibrio fischeri]